MNPFELVKIGAGALIVAGAYFFGLHNGQNSEQLKIAQAQISELTATVKNYETQSLLSKIICSLTLASTFTVNPGPRKLKVINKPLLIK
jgi:uncharacterized membrane protein (Fun14 family)